MPIHGSRLSRSSSIAVWCSEVLLIKKIKSKKSTLQSMKYNSQPTYHEKHRVIDTRLSRSSSIAVWYSEVLLIIKKIKSKKYLTIFSRSTMEITRQVETISTERVGDTILIERKQRRLRNHLLSPAIGSSEPKKSSFYRKHRTLPKAPSFAWLRLNV